MPVCDLCVFAALSESGVLDIEFLLACDLCVCLRLSQRVVCLILSFC